MKTPRKKRLLCPTALGGVCLQALRLSRRRGLSRLRRSLLRRQFPELVRLHLLPSRILRLLMSLILFRPRLRRKETSSSSISPRVTNLRLLPRRHSSDP